MFVLCYYRIKTFTALKDATESKMEELKRTMTYVEQQEQGSKFISNYLKYVLDPSLLYRMFPSDSPGKK